MKKILIGLMLMLAITLAFAKITGTAKLAEDHRGHAIQVGTSMLMESNTITALEHLNENTFATHVNWDVTNDIVDAGGNATWTWVDGAASTLTQVTADQVENVRNAQTLQLTYTVTITTPVAGDAVDISVGTICAKTTLLQTAGTHTTDILTTSAAGNFVITIDPAAGTTAGILVYDDIYLTSKYESPLTIPTGTDVSLTIPDEAATLVIDPIGTEVKIESGVCYYSVWTGHAIGCSNQESITIANDSGGDATVYFYWKMILYEQVED